MDVTRAALIAALMDERPMFAVIEMLDKTNSYATGMPRHPDDYADKLLEHIEGQRATAARFPDAADPEVAAIAAIVAVMDRLDEETALLGTDVHERVIRWAVARYLGPVSGGCPIAVVLGDGMHSCTLPRGHSGDHGYAGNPDED